MKELPPIAAQEKALAAGARMKGNIAALGLLPALMIACAGSDATTVDVGFDDTTLNAFREAIPEGSRLLAGVPTRATAASQADAVLAHQGAAFARDVNRPVRELSGALAEITAREPTRFDRERREFQWGPWHNSLGPGDLMLTIREQAGEHAFRYAYALSLLSESDDLAVPLVWGVSNPDAGHGDSGVFVWDLVASRAFDTHSGVDRGAHAGQGRFAVAYGRADVAMGTADFNLAALRRFAAPSPSPMLPAPQPIDADHFYGHVADAAGTPVDFIQSELDADLCAGAPSTCFERSDAAGTRERFRFDAFFADRGVGRAEVLLENGDLDAPVRLTECWDPTLTRTFYQIDTGDTAVQMMADADCHGMARQSPAELGLPSLADVDPLLLQTLRCAAESGELDCE